MSDNLRALYDERYFMNQVEGHEEFKKGFIHEKKKYLIDLVEVKGKRILDIGYGRGELLQECFIRGAALLVGIDYSDAACRIAKEYCDKSINLFFGQLQMIDGIHFYNFDIVFMIDVIEHILDNELFDCMIKLKSRGMLNFKSEIIISTPLDIRRGDYKGMHINQWNKRRINQFFGIFFKEIKINIYEGNYIVVCKKPF